jgi:hypothetical protein
MKFKLNLLTYSENPGFTKVTKYTILVGTFEGNEHLEDLVVDGGISICSVD